VPGKIQSTIDRITLGRNQPSLHVGRQPRIN
jgi:hypothetical protein